MIDETSFFNFFSFDPSIVHSIGDNGKQWFVASQIFEVLGLAWDTPSAANTLNAICKDAPDNQCVSIEAGVSVTLISDYVLCCLLLQSDTPEANSFQKRVTSAKLTGVQRNDVDLPRAEIVDAA